MSKMKAISLFSSAGISELLLSQIGIEVVAANEIIEKRAKVYTKLHPNSNMIIGDIRNKTTKQKIKKFINPEVELLIITPPCQGLSTLGKNKKQKHLETDRRNFLIFDAFEIIDEGKFKYIFIENVPRFLKMFFPYRGEYLTLEEILNKKYGDKYTIESRILNAKDLGVPQTRPRAIIKMYKKNLTWNWPKKEREITLKEAIGHLPSLESGEDSGIKWHKAKKHKENIVEALRHTPTGRSALENEVYYPKNKNGEKVKGFHNTYKRMEWNRPAHARTTYCGSISSHNNVHPGRLLPDGTYSDARVLTLLETFIVSTIPEEVEFPKWATDSFIRTLIGESIPPLMLNKILYDLVKGR